MPPTPSPARADPPDPPGPPDPVAAVRALARTARLLERACGDLSLAHYRVLAAVDGGEERASRLAERLALGRPAISAAVDALCARHFLDRIEVIADGRAVALSLTVEGQAALHQAEQGMTRELTGLARRTPDASAVLAALATLAPALDAWHDDRRAAR